MGEWEGNGHCAIKYIEIYPVDNNIHLLNNGGQIYFVVCVNAAN